MEDGKEEDVWRYGYIGKRTSMRSKQKSSSSSVFSLTKIRQLFPNSSCILSLKLLHCTPDMPGALTRQRFSSAPDFSPVIFPKDEGKHKRFYNRLKGKMCTTGLSNDVQGSEGGNSGTREGATEWSQSG